MIRNYNQSSFQHRGDNLVTVLALKKLVDHGCKGLFQYEPTNRSNDETENIAVTDQIKHHCIREKQ